jgi:hypothetical protein
VQLFLFTGFLDWESIARAKPASVDVLKFKCLSVHFQFTALTDFFGCVNPVSELPFQIFFHPSAGYRRNNF